MRKPPFYRFGQFIYRWRLPIIFLWVLIILSCMPFLPTIISPFKSTGFVDEHSASIQADHYLARKLDYYSNRFLIIYHSDTLKADSSSYITKIKKSLSALADFPIEHKIIYPDSNKKQISKDKHTAYVVVLFNSNKPMTADLLQRFKNAIKTPKNMSVQLGGESIFLEGVNKQTQKDLYKADVIATPISIITLILVFGSIIAAFLPIVLGGGCALIILTTLYFLGQAFTLSIFTLNIALLLGLCLSLDYSLFIISRFRDELANNETVSDAIATTLATAGKAIFFSGLAVFISLSALLLFPVNILFSVGVGGLAAVFLAVMVAITLLPALLAVLKHNINLLRVRLFKQAATGVSPLWSKIATTVVNHPVFFFVIILTCLTLIGLPFLHVRFGISDFRILPEHSAGRQFFDSYQQHFDRNELAPILVIVKARDGKILSKNHLSQLYDFAKKLKNDPLVARVDSIVTSNSKLKKDQYYELYHNTRSSHNAAVQTLLKTTTGKDFTVFTVVSKYPDNASETSKLITKLEQMDPGKGLYLQLTGTPVTNAQVLHSIANIFPYAVLWIMVLTYLILLVLLRSLFLPFKAILMNVLSLCASYGVLVFIFQEGHLHELLNFDPQGILDISLLIIIFCALFGFSMDYEVFLLTRIREFYLQTKNNNQSIIFGIEKSSRIITSAAIIVIFICGSFMVADVLMVKEFGLGIAVAIFVDAFLIRSILVPATMTLLNKWNWYLPNWLSKILPNDDKPLKPDSLAERPIIYLPRELPQATANDSVKKLHKD